jgi:RHS repeat-associated protein
MWKNETQYNWHSALSLDPLENNTTYPRTNSNKLVQYVGNKVYENNQLDKILLPNGYISNGIYYFYLRDHLGNNCVTAKADGTVMQGLQYYPYGRVNEDESTGIGFQPYKYGGKEFEGMHGLNSHDFLARTLNDYGRFDRMDPLAEKRPWESPYAAMGCNPVRNVDFRGDSLTVLNQGGVVGHSAMLIQNEEGKWQYYSMNGDWVYTNTKGVAGGKDYHDLGEKTFNSPQEFLENAYNSEGTKEQVAKNEVNNYGFKEAYTIPTTPEQDKTIRETFTNIATNETYDIIGNNCATTMLQSLEAGGIQTYNTATIRTYVPANHKIYG